MKWNPRDPGDERQQATEGLAAYAISAGLTVTDDGEALRQLARVATMLGMSGGDVRASAASIASAPTPDHATRFDEILGVTSTSDHLTAMLTARDWLERLAVIFEEAE